MRPSVSSLHVAVKTGDGTRTRVYCLVDEADKARYTDAVKAASSWYPTLHVGLPPRRGPLDKRTVYTWTVPALPQPCAFCGWLS